MSIKGPHEEQARCFRYWPTGRECVTFYFLLFLTVVAVLTAGAVLAFVPDLSCGVQNTFQSVVMMCIGIWIRSPVDYFK